MRSFDKKRGLSPAGSGWRVTIDTGSILNGYDSLSLEGEGQGEGGTP
jgi:hypothetical protein